MPEKRDLKLDRRVGIKSSLVTRAIFFWLFFFFRFIPFSIFSLLRFAGLVGFLVRQKKEVGLFDFGTDYI